MADTTPSPPAPSLDAFLDLLRDRLAPPAAELLSRESFALMLDVGVSTFDRLRETGAIGLCLFKLGGALRWHRGEAIAWLERRDQTGELHSAETWPDVWSALQTRRTK